MIANVTDIENVFLCYPLLLDSCPRAHRLPILKVAMYVFMVLMILTTVFGNLLIIISISHFKQLQSPTHLIVQSLAACDCLLGSLVMPYSMVRSVEGCWYLGDVVCKVHSSLDMTFSISSILHLSLIAIDRYWAICDPLRYRMRLFCCVYRGAIMSSLYMSIFNVVKKHVKVLSEKVSVASAVGGNCQTSSQRERKAAKTLAIVMGVFYLCWLPFFAATAIDPFLNFVTPVDVFDALVWFGYFNSTCNPLIYGFFYPRFQKAFKYLIRKIFSNYYHRSFHDTS
ncbi:trace amine-associated receptor 3-like [Carassius carassius]|uniref:trace amine-associated receptor 3-like n=1 Tax=Carassius carassius TaxID=217509 RepID=UPI002868AD5D|nr:trace amine-associated receptor 3-like [Carassius carassius]